MIRCSHCGTDNRDGARHCKVCGNALPAAAPARPQQSLPFAPGRSIPPAQSLMTAAPSQLSQKPPLQSLVSQPLATRMQAAIVPSTNLRGIVVDDPMDRRDFPERDWGKAMVALAMGIVIAPPLIVALLAAGVVVCGLLVFVGLSLSCVLIPLGLMATLGAFFRGPQRAEVPVYEFRVQDATGGVVNVEMVGRRTGGKITRGDDVEAWGVWRDSQHAALRAWRVQVHHVAGVGGQHVAGSVITADRLWPTSVGWIALAIAVLFSVLVYGGWAMGLYR